MNGLKGSKTEITALVKHLDKADPKPKCDILICPPSTLLERLKQLAKGSRLKFGGQDCHANPTGAYTGDISAEMLKEAGASFIIVGHSERRADHDESNAQVQAKAEAVHRVGVIAIICIGETQAERKAGSTLRVVNAQIKGSLPQAANAKNTVIAYEPVWAIGTGLTPTVQDVEKVHGAIRKQLAKLLGQAEADKMRILYGGSVKPTNADELMAVADVDGALVGGASLKAKDFWGIIKAYM
jgi:triosephosphate isomerase